MQNEKYHDIKIDGARAEISMASAYLPTVGHKEYTLLSHYIDLLNDVAALGPLDSLKVSVELYGNATDEELGDVEREMKRDWDSLALHQDELLHVGALSGVMDFAWLSGCIVLGVLKPLLLPLLLPYVLFNILQTLRRAKKLLVAAKFKDCSCEIANCLKVIHAPKDDIAKKIDSIVECFEKLDGSTQDIHLKLAAKADTAGLEAVRRYYAAHFGDSKPRGGLISGVVGTLKAMIMDEDTRKIKIPARPLRKAPLLRDSRRKRSIEFVVLPTHDSLEMYLADEFSDGDMYPPSMMPPALHPVAHLVSESDVVIDNVVRTPEDLELEHIRPKISQSLYITAYSARKFHAMKMGQLVSFEKRQIPIALVVIGVLHMAFGFFRGSFFLSPVLIFGAATLGASLLLTRSVKKHFSDIAEGFDRIFEDFTHPALVKDEKLAELNALVKDSENLFDAYTEAFHRALHFGWNGIADVYQSKAVFHQREFKEPGRCIMRIER